MLSLTMSSEVCAEGGKEVLEYDVIVLNKIVFIIIIILIRQIYIALVTYKFQSAVHKSRLLQEKSILLMELTLLILPRNKILLT